MTLLDVVGTLHQFDEEDTIYLQEPWGRDSIALVRTEPEAGGVPPEAQMLGLIYFIEVAIACEFLEDWLASLSGAPMVAERCDRLIQFAVNDA